MSLVNDALRKTRKSFVSKSGSDDAGGRTWIDSSIALRRQSHVVAITVFASTLLAAGSVVAFVWLFGGDRSGPRQAAAAVLPMLPQIVSITDGANGSPVPPPPLVNGTSEPSQPPDAVVVVATDPPAPVAPPARMAEPSKSLPETPPQSPAAPPVILPTGIDAEGVYIRQIDAPGVTAIKLDAIIWSAENPIALINGTAITPGTVLGNVRVKAIESRRITLEHAGVSFFLRLP